MARNSRTEKPKTFPHYLELPSELRKAINDEMDPKDMCRFTRTSKLCKEEVQKSKKYVYGLEFEESSEESVEITVDHARSVYQPNYYYQVVFEENSDKKYMKYLIPSGNSSRQLWSIDLDRSDNLVQIASDYFKKLLKCYQNSIEQLTITGKRNYNFQVRSLNNLKDLELSTNVGNIMEVISKRKVPLEELSYKRKMNNQLLGDFEYIYQVQEDLNMPTLKLNIDQYRLLSASDVVTHIGTLTPNDIYNYITDWKNGELRENLRRSSWKLDNSNFCVHELWSLFGQTHKGHEREQFYINHNKEAGRCATLIYTVDDDERLSFWP